jgi:hypothetical protein
MNPETITRLYDDAYAAVYDEKFLLSPASAPNRWGLVSCMWYAYGLIDTVTDLLRLIENMAALREPAARPDLTAATPAAAAAGRRCAADAGVA